MLNSAPVSTDRVSDYVAGIAAACGRERGVVSIVVFGSANTGGYSPGVSDVDLLIVVDDSASMTDREYIAQAVTDLELRLGLAKPRTERRRFGLGSIQSVVDKITGNVRTFFICTQADLLSGEPGRILGLSRLQSAFVDRIAIPSIVGSGATLWGEDLLGRVPFLPVRRWDVGKAGFGLFNQGLIALAVYPILPEATRYAMEALKRSLHSCYLCFHGRPASLTSEIAFFEKQYGRDPAYSRLVELRNAYRPSVKFILQSLPAIARLHTLTARDARMSRTRRPDEGPAS